MSSVGVVVIVLIAAALVAAPYTPVSILGVVAALIAGLVLLMIYESW